MRWATSAVWAQEGCARALERTGAADRDRMTGLYAADGQADVAEQIRSLRLVTPDHLVDQCQHLVVGGRPWTCATWGEGTCVPPGLAQNAGRAPGRDARLCSRA